MNVGVYVVDKGVMFCCWHRYQLLGVYIYIYIYCRTRNSRVSHV